MQLLIYVLSFLLLSCNDTKEKCDDIQVRAFTHYNSNQKLDIYNEPFNGKLLKKMDPHEEAGYILQIIGAEKDFFKVSFEDLDLKNVWVKKGTLGLITRNYDDQKLNLYSKPNLDSSVSSVLQKEQIVRVLGACNKWAYVETISDGEIKRGWLQPEMQCANPYTTCP